jgi:hypothetical protein
MSWSMPHLQAAQRRISRVVPVKLPLILGAMSWSACGASPARNRGPTGSPLARL